jgi:TonB family protein
MYNYFRAMRKFFLYCITILISCLSFIAHAQPKFRYFSFERTACFGKCPTYQIELQANGTLTYHGKANVEKLGSFVTQCNAKEMLAIRKAMIKYKLPTKSITYKKKSSDLSELNYWYEANKKRILIKNVHESNTSLLKVASLIDSLVAKKKNWKDALPLEEGSTGSQLQVEAELPPKDVIVEEKIYGEFELTERHNFPGGQEAMSKYIQQNLKYPEIARENDISGRVIVSFCIHKDGSVYDARVLKSPDASLSKEAIRLIESMPKWLPGKVNGVNVSSKQVIPIMFVLK